VQNDYDTSWYECAASAVQGARE